MSKAQWLKLSVSIMQDEKIRLIRRLPHGDSFFALWIGLLCFAMQRESAALYIVDGEPVSEVELALLLDFDEEVVVEGLAIFEWYKMITRDESGVITITKFDEHQALEEIDRKRILATERKRKSRLSFHVTQSERDKSVTCHAPVTQCHATEEEVEVEEEYKNPVRVPRAGKTPSLKSSDTIPGADFEAIEVAWDDAYQTENGSQYVRNFGRERKLLAPLIKAVGAGDVARRVAGYFALPAQYWPRTVERFVQKFNAIDAAARGQRASPVKAPPRGALDLSGITRSG